MNAPSSRVTYSASLVTQGQHRFYTLSMPSDVLAKCSSVDTRDADPVAGFQRKLDRHRADEIARYIDEEGGSIPSSIVLSAQADAQFEYSRERRSISFAVTGKSFLILDGQHRVYGFSKAKTSLRVPVVIYNGLSRAEECRLFIDINTKQRPVPSALLLDIKRLADIESEDEAFLRDVFDIFCDHNQSPLTGLMSRSAQVRGRLSRVSFNAALSSIESVFSHREAERVFVFLAPYLRVWREYFEKTDRADLLANPTVFRAIMLLFKDVALRVQGDFSADKYESILGPSLEKLSLAIWKKPGASYKALHEKLQRALARDFKI